jgi:alpha-beta hydrolase superfamily lysophospholipase
MGGAVAYRAYMSKPDLYSGVIFMAPMCKIADDLMPPRWLIEVGKVLAGPTGTASIIGALPISPAKNNLKMLSYKLAEKRALFTRVPTVFGRNPRLATARELLVSRLCLIDACSSLTLSLTFC